MLGGESSQAPKGTYGVIALCERPRGGGAKELQSRPVAAGGGRVGDGIGSKSSCAPLSVRLHGKVKKDWQSITRSFEYSKSH